MSKAQFVGQTEKSQKSGSLDNHKKERLVRTFGGKVSDELIEVRVDKVKKALTQLEEAAKRLSSLGIDKNEHMKSTYLEVHSKLVERFNKAMTIKDNKQKDRELDDIKADAIYLAEESRRFVAALVASRECGYCLKLLDDSLESLKENNSKSKELESLEKTRNSLAGQYEKGRTKGDIEKRAKALQSLRSQFRLQVAEFQAATTRIRNEAIDLDALAKQASEALNRAENEVQKMDPSNLRLEERLDTCRKGIQNHLAKIEYRDSAISGFNDGIKEAGRISKLASKPLQGSSEAEAIIRKSEEAKQLALNPDSPEALMIAGFAPWGNYTADKKKEEAEKKFFQMLTNAYEAVAIAGADLSELSPGEVVAIFNYTTQDFQDMNQHCREKFKDKESSELYDRKNGIALQALTKMNPDKKYDGICMRGENLWKGHEERYRLDNTFTINQFWSTGIKMCFDWAPLQITIFGKSGMRVEAMSEKPDETEVLFPVGTKFKVTGRHEVKVGKDEIKYSILLEEVD